MRKFMFACIVVPFLASCEVLTEQESNLPPVPLTFNVDIQREVLPFPVSRTDENPEFLPEETSSAYTQLEYFVYKGSETKAFKHRHYTEGDEDFSIVYDTLPEGNYKVAFLAHSSPKAPITEEGKVFFEEISDTFSALNELTVSTGVEKQQDITLERVVSKIEFRASDTVPKAVKQFDIAITNYPRIYSILSSKGEVPNGSSANATISHVFSPEEIGAKSYIHSFYTFITGKTITLRVSAKDKNNATYVTQVVTVTPEINKIIRYTGNLYTFTKANDIFNISVNNTWSETKEEVLSGK